MNTISETLSTVDVTFGYGRHGNMKAQDSSNPILENISLQMGRGQLVTLVGANGSGKSTLLRLLSGILQPHLGSVRVDGTPLRDLSAQAAAQSIAYVAQENPATFAFTVAELVGLGIRGAEGTAQPSPNAQQSLDESLERFDLSGLAHRSLITLSGGQRQRAHLARGWAQRAPFLLLDEPTAHQDIGHQARLMGLFRAGTEDEAMRRTVIVAMHDLNLAASWAHRLVLLHEGRIIADGSPPTAALDADILSAMYGIPIEVCSVGGTNGLWVQPRRETPLFLNNSKPTETRTSNQVNPL